MSDFEDEYMDNFEDFDDTFPNDDDDVIANAENTLKRLKEKRKQSEAKKSGNQTVVTNIVGKEEADVTAAALDMIFEKDNKKAPSINNIQNAMDFVQNQNRQETFFVEETPPEEMEKQAKKETVWTMMDKLDKTEAENGIKQVKREKQDDDDEDKPPSELPPKKVYPQVRKYTNQISKEQIVFRKPVEEGAGGWKKVVIFLIACLAVGIFIGLKANSYYIAKAGKVASVLACAWSWLADDVPFSLKSFNPDVFFSGFGIGAGGLGLVGLFTWLDNDAKKQSRVGHEHGNARLATPSDFKKYKKQFMENNDNNMLFGVYRGQEFGLSLNNKKVNRSANVLVIGGTGTGKTFKYIKPNLLQENASVVVTDPSGDIFKSFAPYLLSKGYNVFLFNANDFSMSNHYNPLLNVYDSQGNISENQVNILVDLYMKNAKQGKEAGGGDPFWDKSEKAFITALIYYVLENEHIPKRDKCFHTILQKVKMAKVSDDAKVMSPLTREMYDWFVETEVMTYKGGTVPPAPDTPEKEVKKEDYRETGKETNYKTKLYYDIFLIAPEKTANTILITTAVDLAIFDTEMVDFITREDIDNPENNINIDTFATQQSYMFLGIPQAHQAYNFLIAMLYSQLYGRLYELGESKIRNKWHIGYKFGTPVFNYFNSKEEALDFYEHITKEDITDREYLNGTTMYRLSYKGITYKYSVLKEPLERLVDDLDKMYIWNGDEFAGSDPALPIHVNFLLDEFKNIGEIPNFLTILSTSRKYRIGSHCVIQDIGQIKTMYKEGEHETLLANVDTVIFLGSNLKEDKEEIQKMLGKTTIRQKSTSSSNSGLSTSYAPTEVDLMSIDEIDAINQGGRDDEIVIIRNVTPFLCRKLNLTEHKRWKDVKAAKLDRDVSDYYDNKKQRENFAN